MDAIAAAATKAVQPVKASEYESPCAPGQDQRSSDLCAQWKAADSAAKAAEWAKWQTIFSALGVAGLIYSLHLTRKAVKAATDASAHADESLAMAQVSAERQLRAYLSIDKILVTEISAGSQLEVWIKVANRGQTPARNIRQRECAVRCIGATADSAKIKLGKPHKVYDLGAGQTVSLPTTLTPHKLNGSQVASLRMGGVEFVVAGYISYRDIFGKLRRMIYRATLTKESLMRAAPGEEIYLSVADKGIRSN